MSNPGRNTLTPHRATPLRVVVLENDIDTLCMMGKILSKLGIDALPATHSKAAEECARAHGPVDLIPADAHLESEDGLAAALQLKRSCGCALIITSGDDRPDDGLPEGVDAWLVKPIDTTRLQETIKAVIKGSG